MYDFPICLDPRSPNLPLAPAYIGAATDGMVRLEIPRGLPESAAYFAVITPPGASAQAVGYNIGADGTLWIPNDIVPTPGAGKYEIFADIDGRLVFVGAGALNVIGCTTGVDPVIPPPVVHTYTLDFALLNVLNAPYYTMAQSDARYLTPSAGDERYAAKGEPLVYTSLTIDDRNEDNTLAISSNARTITMVRDATSETPRTFVLTLPLATGTVALTSQIPDVSGYARTGAANTFTAAQTFTADLTADHIYPKVIELNGSAATRDDAWANYMADYGTVGSIIRDTLADYIRDKSRYTIDTLTVTNGAAQLIDRSVQLLALTSASTDVLLPASVSGHSRDLYLCVRNDSGATAAIELYGLGTAFAVRVPDGESLSDMTEFESGARADFYITETSEVSNGLPVFKIVRQDLGAAEGVA